MSFELTAPDKSDKPEERIQFQRRYISALESIPGVTNAALTSSIPLAGCCFSTTLYPEGRPNPAAVERVSFHVISPQYLPTMRIPLRSGRALDDRDVREDPVAVLVSESAARTYWPGQNALGSLRAFGRARRHARASCRRRRRCPQ